MIIRKKSYYDHTLFIRMKCNDFHTYENFI